MAPVSHCLSDELTMMACLPCLLTLGGGVVVLPGSSENVVFC